MGTALASTGNEGVLASACIDYDNNFSEPLKGLDIVFKAFELRLIDVKVYDLHPNIWHAFVFTKLCKNFIL